MNSFFFFLVPLYYIHTVIIIINRFLDCSVWNHLQKSRRDTGNNIVDIYDGKEYKKHQRFLSQPGNITLTVNTDGVSIFNSANISLWPVWLAINELPPHVRYINTYIQIVYMLV